MVVITEQFLNITMRYGGNVGNKGYSVKSGASIELGIYNTSNNRNINKQTVSSYSQTTIPIGITYGRKATTANITGKLCELDGVSNLLSIVAAGRSGYSVNTLYNVLLPCSIISLSGSDVPDLNGYWMVDIFKIKRNIQKREIIEFELSLIKWYESVPPS